MLTLARQPAMMAASPDRLRGTMQRWTVDAGPLAGTVCDYAFNEDWSVTWRMVAGPEQGRVGRARGFHMQAVRAQVVLVSFLPVPGETITGTVDFASRRFVAVRTCGERSDAMSGPLRVL